MSRRIPSQCAWIAVGTTFVVTACGARMLPPKNDVPAAAEPVVDARAPASLATSERPIQDAGSDACIVGTREPADDGCNTRICLPDHTWATTLLKCDRRLLAITLLDGTHPSVCSRTGADNAGAWAALPDEPFCVIVSDLDSPKPPTAISVARDRAHACGRTNDPIDVELAFREDRSVIQSTVLSTNQAKTKLGQCVASAYRAVSLRTLPRRALTVRIHHSPLSP